MQLAPSLAGPLLGALDFLTGYPYGCTEQTLSSFVPNLIVRRTLTALKLPPTERLKSLDRQVTEGLTRLYDFQHDDGGWGWWKTDENHPFMTAYAIYGLLEAKTSGYKVDQWRVGNGIRALRKMYLEYPRAIPELKAYEAYVLVRAAAAGFNPEEYGDGRKWEQKAALDELWSARGRMTPYGSSLLLQTLDAVKDAAPTRSPRNSPAAVQRKGDLAWWPTDRDPLLVRLRRHQRRSHRPGRAGAGGPRPEARAARAGGPLAAAQPHLRHLLGQHEADRDGALRPARPDEGPAGRPGGFGGRGVRERRVGGRPHVHRGLADRPRPARNHGAGQGRRRTP